MPAFTPRRSSAFLVMAWAGSAIVLTACNPPARTAATDATAEAGDTSNSLALPLTSGPAVPIGAAPTAEALPSAPLLRITRPQRRADDYAYADQAYAMNSAIGQAPPDYGFDYGPTHPWVWRSQTNALRVVEPVAGGDRYFYFQPGVGEPYLIRDPDYAYAYTDGQLVTIYDRQGRELSPAEIDRRLNWAGRYLVRGRALWAASAETQKDRVAATAWAARRARINAAQESWTQQRRQSDNWNAYHAEHDAEQQAYWRAEQAQRDRSSQDFEAWKRRGYEGAAPLAGDRRAPEQLDQSRAFRPDNRPDLLPMAGPRPVAVTPTEQQDRERALADARRQQADADRARPSPNVDESAARLASVQAQARSAAIAAVQLKAESEALVRVRAETARQVQAQAQVKASNEARGRAELIARTRQRDADAALASALAVKRADMAAAVARQAEARAKAQNDAPAAPIARTAADAKPSRPKPNDPRPAAPPSPPMPTVASAPDMAKTRDRSNEHRRQDAPGNPTGNEATGPSPH